LGGGPPRFIRASTRPVLLENSSEREARFRLRDYHPLWSSFPEGSANGFFFHSPGALQTPRGSHNPLCTTPAGLHAEGLGSYAFARRYSRSRLLSFLSSGYLDVSVPPVGLRDLSIQPRMTGHDPRQVFPLGDLGVLAWLAARPSFSQLPHVRLRLLAPKHPPCTLCSLTIFFYGPPSQDALSKLALPFGRSQDLERLPSAPTGLRPRPAEPTSPFFKELAATSREKRLLGPLFREARGGTSRACAWWR
jgi:hypothetical protein